MAISLRKPLFLLLALVLLGPVRAEANPDIQHWTTTHGLKVYFVHAPQVPMLDIRLVFHAGSAYDGKHPGLAQLTSNLVGSGADGMDADAIATRFDAVGAQFGTGALRDMAWVSLRSLNAPEYLDPALSTLINLLARPTFPQADYARTLKQMQVGLQAQEQDPGAIADKAMMHALYGDHPYASPPEGTMQSLKRIRRSDVKDYFRRYYVARNGVLALVGAVDRAQAEKIAARIGAALAEGKPAPALPPVPPLAKAQTIRIPYPSAQAHILIGQPGIRRGAADYVGLFVGNHILGGGGFSSELVRNVRVKRGLSYSVGSYFVPMQRKGPFMISLQTKVDQTDEALKVVRDTLQRFIAQGPNAKALKAAQENLVGGFPLRIASNSQVVQYLALIGFYNLPLDYLDTFPGKVEAVTGAEIRRDFRRTIHPDRLVTVIVGGPQAAQNAQVR